MGWQRRAKSAVVTVAGLPHLLGPGNAGLVPDSRVPDDVAPVGIERRCDVSADTPHYYQSSLDLAGQIQTEQDREQHQRDAQRETVADTGAFAPSLRSDQDAPSRDRDAAPDRSR
jgi:hypothetical protein